MKRLSWNCPIANYIKKGKKDLALKNEPVSELQKRSLLAKENRFILTELTFKEDV